MRKLLYLFTLLALAACSVSDFEADREGMVPINLTVDMADAVVTRAGTAVQSTQFAQEETFNAYFPSGNTTVTTTTYKTSNTSGATNCTGTQPYFNAGATSSTVRAFYPSSVTYTTNSFSVQQAQNTDANYKLSDLMYAQNTLSKGTATTATASMTFNHKLSKIVVNATAGSGVSKITDVRIIGGYRTINISTPATCTLGSSLSNANSTSSYITMYSGGTSSTANCAAIIPPQTINGNFLQIVTDKGTATYALSGKAVASGYVYTIGVTVNAAAVGITTTITGWGSSASLTIQPTVTETRYVATPVGAIPGLFTINADGDQVFFSKGNLQYDGTNWKFATNQYEVLGANGTKANGTATGYPMDLFTWGNIDNPTYNGNTYTSGTANLSGTYDWGSNAISNGGNTANSGWRTLSKDEWLYLFGMESSNTDKNGHVRYRKYFRATVNGVKGIVVLPDDITGISDIPAESNRGTASTFDGKTYTIAGWSTLESAGCVFLPAAGFRSGTSVDEVGSSGNYWSSSAYETGSAYYMFFHSGGVDPAMSDPRDNGFSVRLVRRAWYKEMSSATSSDIGKIICSNGHIHTNVSDVTCANGTAVAIVAYVGNGEANSSYDHGLALSMEDLTSGSDTKWRSSDSDTDLAKQYSSITSECLADLNGLSYTETLIGKGASYPAAQKIAAYRSSCSVPSGCSDWFLPTIGQWSLILQGLTNSTTALSIFNNSSYKGSAINTILEGFAGTSARIKSDSGIFWSTTEGTPNGVWAMSFYYGRANEVNKASEISVRAVLAF